MSESVLFTDLDTILDTRLATIFTINKDAATLAISTNYHERIQDVFTNIDYDLFRETYNKRDKTILASAVVTRIINMVIEFAETTYEENIDDAVYTVPKLIVNIYPYDLTEDEKKVVLSGIVAKSNKQIDVDLVNMSYEELTPKWINSNIDIMTMYDYNEWLETHSVNKNFEEALCSDVTLLAPKVIFSKELPKIENKTVEVDALFSDMEKYISPFIAIRFLPIYHFSAAVKLIEKQSNT